MVALGMWIGLAIGCGETRIDGKQGFVRDPIPPVPFDPGDAPLEPGDSGLVAQDPSVLPMLQGYWLGECEGTSGTGYMAMESAEITMALQQADDQLGGEATIEFFATFFGSTFPTGTIEGGVTGQLFSVTELTFTVTDDASGQQATFTGSIAQQQVQGSLVSDVYGFYGTSNLDCVLVP